MDDLYKNNPCIHKEVYYYLAEYEPFGCDEDCKYRKTENYYDSIPYFYDI